LRKIVAAYDLAIQPLSKGTRKIAHPRPVRRFVTPSCRHTALMRNVTLQAR
jgi:hypothetical protein